MDFFFSGIKVVMLGDEIMLMRSNLFGTQVMRADGSVWLSCELAPLSEFVLVGDFD